MSPVLVTYPRAEVDGGWRALRGEEVRDVGGFDPAVLALAAEEERLLFGGELWSLVVIREGALAAEMQSHSALEQSRFNVHSVTKAVTALGFGILFEDFRRAGRERELNLDSRLYELADLPAPEDERRREITLGQLLSMTSGIVGIADGAFTAAQPSGEGFFEHVLGLVPGREGLDASRLAAEPGTRWAYSDVAFAHLALAFSAVAGVELDTFLARRLFAPIGVEGAVWARAGGGERIGRHPVCHSGLVLSARELARLGLLVLRGGEWAGEEIVAPEWVARVTGPSQDLNPRYGYGFWLNSARELWPMLPEDAFGMVGFRGNRCWIVPSLDLVVARAATGPALLDDRYFPGRIVEAILA